MTPPTTSDVGPDVGPHAATGTRATTEPSATPGLDRVVWPVALGVLALVTFLLRVSDLGPSSLFVDDAWTAYIHRTDVGDAPLIGLTSVGFVVLLKGWFSLVGYSDAIAQIPPLAFGVVAPALLAVVLRRRVGRALALAAGLALAVNEIHITYSTRVKQYSFDTWWSIVCVAFVLWVARGGVTIRRAAVVGAAGLVAALVSFSTTVPTLGVMAAAMWSIGASTRASRRIEREHVVATGILASSGILIVAWYVGVVRPNVSEGIRAYWQDNYVVRDTLVGSIRSLGSLYRQLVANVVGIDAGGWATAFLVLGALLVVVALVRSPGTTIGFVVPLVAAGALAFVGRAPLGAGRTDSALLVPALVAAVIGADEIRRWSTAVVDRRAGPDDHPAAAWGRWFGTVVLAGLVVVAAAAPPDARGYPDNDARFLVETIDRERAPGAAVLLHRSRFVYGLYTTRDSRPQSDGYLYQPVYDDGVVTSGLRWSTTAEDAHRRRLTSIGERSDDLWLLSSPIGSAAELSVFDEILLELGFVRVDRIEASQAVLDHWVRAAAVD